MQAELSKLLQLKQEKIKKLGTLNKEVEKLVSRYYVCNCVHVCIYNYYVYEELFFVTTAK